MAWVDMENSGLTLLPASFRQYDAIGDADLHVQIKLTQGSSVAISYACDHLLVLHLDRHKGFSEVYNGSGAPVWAQIRHKAGHGRQRAISLAQLQKIAVLNPSFALPRIRAFPVMQ